MQLLPAQSLKPVRSAALQAEASSVTNTPTKQQRLLPVPQAEQESIPVQDALTATTKL